jgi:large subunit ribosomal protein L30
MGLKIKLIKSHSGSSERQLATIFGLGLKKFGSESLLKDTPAIRGMLKKVLHLVSFEVVKEEPKVLPRQKPRKIKVRDAARAKALAAK